MPGTREPEPPFEVENPIRFSDRVGVGYLGRIVQIATADRLFAEPRHPYTRLLLES